MKFVSKIIKNKPMIAFTSGVVVYDLYKLSTVGIYGIEWAEFTIGVVIIILSVFSFFINKDKK